MDDSTAQSSSVHTRSPPITHIQTPSIRINLPFGTTNHFICIFIFFFFCFHVPTVPKRQYCIYNPLKRNCRKRFYPPVAADVVRHVLLCSALGPPLLGSRGHAVGGDIFNCSVAAATKIISRGLFSATACRIYSSRYGTMVFYAVGHNNIECITLCVHTRIVF